MFSSGITDKSLTACRDVTVTSGRLFRSSEDHRYRARNVKKSDACGPNHNATHKQNGGYDASRSETQ
jgi:hypothetical protein